MSNQSSPHFDPEWLREKYHGEGMTLQEMADVVGLTPPAISKQMEKNGIPRRNHGRWSEGLTAFYHQDGYEVVSSSSQNVRIHRLAYVAWHGLDALKEHIHHENGIRWDNREENLTAYTNYEHAVEHHCDIPENPHHDPEWLQKRLDEGASQKEIAAEVGVSQPTIHHHLKKNGLI